MVLLFLHCLLASEFAHGGNHFCRLYMESEDDDVLYAQAAIDEYEEDEAFLEGTEGIPRPNISPATIQECFVGSEVIISVSDISMHSVVWIDALICTYVFQPASCCYKRFDVHVILF